MRADPEAHLRPFQKRPCAEHDFAWPSQCPIQISSSDYRLELSNSSLVNADFANTYAYVTLKYV